MSVWIYVHQSPTGVPQGSLFGPPLLPSQIRQELISGIGSLELSWTRFICCQRKQIPQTSYGPTFFCPLLNGFGEFSAAARRSSITLMEHTPPSSPRSPH